MIDEADIMTDESDEMNAMLIFTVMAISIFILTGRQGSKTKISIADAATIL